MADSKDKQKAEQLDRLVAGMRREQQDRQAGYREKALKLFSPVCGRCGREFEGKKLRELTVHHIDHNHDNNPPDGSNWELLCIYCHENEHARYATAEAYDEAGPGESGEASSGYRPFAGLDALLREKK